MATDVPIRGGRGRGAGGEAGSECEGGDVVVAGDHELRVVSGTTEWVQENGFAAMKKIATSTSAPSSTSAAM